MKKLEEIVIPIETKTNSEIEERLEKEYHVDLLVFMIQKQNEMQENGFDGKIYEELFDFYGKYDTEKIIKSIEIIEKDLDLVRDYFKNRCKDIDLKYFSETLEQAKYFLMRGDIEIVPLKRVADEMISETDSAQIKNLSIELEKQIDDILSKNEYEFWNGEEMEGLTKEALLHLQEKVTISQKIGNSSLTLDGFREVAFALQKANFENKFQESVGQVDMKKLEKDTLKYGAKGANLQVVSDTISKIEKLLPMFDENYFVPDFEKMSVLIYKKWKNGENIEDELKPFFQWINNRKVIIRSSAVYSEDNENITGAGIYDSIVINKDETFNNFKNHVIAIYKSIDASFAQKYRNENKIEQEEMGIILQEYIPHNSNSNKGYVNTVVKQVPELMDVLLNSGYRPVIDKSILEKICANDSIEYSIFHYQLDSYKLENIHSIEKLAKVSLLLEKYYNKAIQIEFIFTEEKDDNSMTTKNKIAILQARFLPDNFSQPAQIEFPQKEALFEGRALGVVDVTLEVLPSNADNSEAEGVVIFQSSKFSSMESNSIDNSFPKKGAVIILGASIENFGHIETLCAEKGLFLVFNNRYTAFRDKDYLPGLQYGDKNTKSSNNIYDYKKLQLVLDGLKGKIYAPEE